MSTDLPTTVKNIQRLLSDNPVEDYITGAIATSVATTFTVANVAIWDIGNVWEFDDGTTGAEQVLVRDVDTTTSTITVKRGHNGSTATTHANGAITLKSRRFRYDEVAQAVNQVIDAVLWENELYDITEHIITSSATTDVYTVPTTSCLRPLSVYQRINTADEPQYLRSWSRRYTNVDTSLFANGAYIVIRENLGTRGTSSYYLDCAHRLTISTITPAMERPVQYMAAYYLLTWKDIKRTAGPTNQSERSVPVLTASRLASFYKAEADRMFKEQAALLTETLAPQPRRFVRGGRWAS